MNADRLALKRISSGISLLVTSERTSVFKVKYSDLLGYLGVNKGLFLSWGTYHLPVRSLVVAENGLDLFSNHEHRLFPGDARVLAMLIIDVPEGDVRRVVLDQPQTWTTRNGCRKMEAKISLLCLPLSRQGTSEQ